MLKVPWPKPFQYFRNVRFFLVSLCIIIAAIVSCLFYLLYHKTTELQNRRMRDEAIQYSNLIQHLKNWNYDYGGVYVAKQPGVQSNAYLLSLGIPPDLKTTDGRTLTIRNHAIMLDELSQRIQLHDGIRFRAVSNKPLSPDNLPDNTETLALSSFDKGAREFYKTEQSGPHGATFRYIVPLLVEQSCLECHTSQGYSIGNIIGAISISMPIAKALGEMNKNRFLIASSAVLTIGILVAVVYFLTWRLVIHLDVAQRNLKKLASTDELTGLKNRRQILKRLQEEFDRSGRLNDPLSIILLDIDHFKQVNDTYGHPCGDQVLKQVATIMNESLRRYDSVGRIGGEEFMIICPGALLDEAAILADRLRQSIKDDRFSDGATSFAITISAGVALASSADKNANSIIKRADCALYRAKQDGRDRVVTEDAPTEL